ncbi:MAG: hypothetical protein JNK23_10595 [Opitutaceae bacterium]|nr:hypothetical protein [Opitutaceae bacterium]
MNTFLIALFAFVAILALTSWVASRPRGRQLHGLVNVAEGFQPAIRTLLTDAAIATRYLLVKRGSDAAHVALAGTADVPIGFVTDEASAAEEGIAVAHFGLLREGALGVASGAIAADEFLVPGANGTVRKLPVAAGTYHIIGRATKAAADTAVVEYTPSFPIQRVVA